MLHQRSTIPPAYEVQESGYHVTTERGSRAGACQELVHDNRFGSHQATRWKLALATFQVANILWSLAKLGVPLDAEGRADGGFKRAPTDPKNQFQSRFLHVEYGQYYGPQLFTVLAFLGLRLFCWGVSVS